MEANKVAEKITDKKLNEFVCNMDNFVAEKELLVTITLSEYRELVSEKAKKDYEIRKVILDKADMSKENEELKKANAELREKLNAWYDSEMIRRGENK